MHLFHYNTREEKLQACCRNFGAGSATFLPTVRFLHRRRRLASRRKALAAAVVTRTDICPKGANAIAFAAYKQPLRAQSAFVTPIYVAI
jgi:hypothetical protein